MKISFKLRTLGKLGDTPRTLLCRPRNETAIELRRFELVGFGASNGCSVDFPIIRPPISPMASELRRGALGGSALVVVFSGVDSSSSETSAGMELVLHSLRGRYLPWAVRTVVISLGTSYTKINWSQLVGRCFFGDRAPITWFHQSVD